MISMSSESFRHTLTTSLTILSDVHKFDNIILLIPMRYLTMTRVEFQIILI